MGDMNIQVNTISYINQFTYFNKPILICMLKAFNTFKYMYHHIFFKINFSGNTLYISIT